MWRPWCHGWGTSCVVVCLSRCLTACVSTSLYVPPVAYSSLNGQTHVVGSDYRPRVPELTGMPISAPVVTWVATRAHYDVPEADGRPRDHSASVCPEHRDTLLRDKPLANTRPKKGVKTPKMNQGPTLVNSTMLIPKRLAFDSPVRLES